MTASLEKASVRAGESFKLALELDKAPSDEGTIVSIFARIPEGDTFICFTPGKVGIKSVIAEFKVPVDISGGRYELRQVSFHISKQNPLSLSNKPIIEVLPKQDLVLPSSAVSTLTLSREQLLRVNARRVQMRIGAVKDDVRRSAFSEPQLRIYLTRVLTEAYDDLSDTKTKYETLGPVNPEDQALFTELSRTYKRAIDLVKPRDNMRSSIQASSTSGIRLASFEAAQVDTFQIGTYPLLTEGALRALEQNELAFEIVMETHKSTFDLRVESFPEGAAISYYPEGEPESAKSAHDLTATLIESLTLGKWEIHLEKDGFVAKDREFDPFREHEKSVFVELTPKKRK